MKSSQRVIINTSVQYIRLAITIVIALFTTRTVLIALGVDDFGIYTLISSIVALLSFINSAMSLTTQRFLSVAQGENDVFKQKKIFINSFYLHLALSLGFFLIVEIIGLFLFKGFLNIPENRIITAKYIYHFMAISLIFTIISVPFIATFMAHENILFISLVYIIESIIKLTVALILLKISVSDKLLLYGLLMTVLSFILFFVYAFFCCRNYKKISGFSVKYLDKGLLSRLTSFAGWNMFNAFGNAIESQGVAILLNNFFGARINAAQGIAIQVSTQFNYLSQSLLNAINPQIMKNEGAKDRKNMFRLSMIASKYSFFLVSSIAIPALFEMPAILSIWLKELPPLTIDITRLIILSILLNQLTAGLSSANQAIGNIRNFTIIIYTIRLSILPLGYFFLKLGFSALSVYIIYVILIGIASLTRIYLVNKDSEFNYLEFIHRVFLCEILPIVFSVISCVIVISVFNNISYRFILTMIISFFVNFLSIYFFGIFDDEKNIVYNAISKFVSLVKIRK